MSVTFAPLILRKIAFNLFDAHSEECATEVQLNGNNSKSRGQLEALEIHSGANTACHLTDLVAEQLLDATRQISTVPANSRT